MLSSFPQQASALYYALYTHILILIAIDYFSEKHNFLRLVEVTNRYLPLMFFILYFTDIYAFTPQTADSLGFKLEVLPKLIVYVSYAGDRFTKFYKIVDLFDLSNMNEAFASKAGTSICRKLQLDLAKHSNIQTAFCFDFRCS